MSWIDDLELSELLSRVLDLRKQRLRAGAEEPREPAADGPVWSVQPVAGGGFAVVRADTTFDPRRDPVLFERRSAYMTAAIMTALGGPEATDTAPPTLRADLSLDELAAATELAEPPPAPYGRAATAPDEPTAARLIQGLLRHPVALELLLEAVDPEVLAEAERLATRGEAQDHDPPH